MVYWSNTGTSLNIFFYMITTYIHAIFYTHTIQYMNTSQYLGIVHDFHTWFNLLLRFKNKFYLLCDPSRFPLRLVSQHLTFLPKEIANQNKLGNLYFHLQRDNLFFPFFFGIFFQTYSIEFRLICQENCYLSGIVTLNKVKIKKIKNYFLDAHDANSRMVLSLLVNI